MADATWLDRAIGWASPVRGLRRAQARKLSEALAYDGARADRRATNWISTGASADTEISAVLGRLRDRARDLVRNNPYASHALDVKTANTIGVGIMAEVKSRRLAGLWDRFVEECDAERAHDLYGLQDLAERVRSESGEALIRFENAPLSDGRAVPLRLRVLEPDYLDSTKDGTFIGANIRNGIEYDAAGAPVAYWLYREHPGDLSSFGGLNPRGLDSVRVPAADVIHVFRKLRAGQTRGVTDFAPVLMRMRNLDEYDDAETMRKKIEACLAAFVTAPAGADAARLGPVTTDTDGRVETLSPGMIEYLAPGEQIAFSDPKASGGYADFQRFGLRAIAAGYGIPYELLAQDLSQVNYSSYRAGLVDFRLRIARDQWLIHVPRVCRRIAARFRAEVQGMQGTNVGAQARFEWTPPRFELIDPLKETEAELEACLAGFDTWDEIVRRRGWTAQEQLDAIEAWQKQLKERGIVLKSDPRAAMAAKQAAAPPPRREPDEPDEPEDDDAQAAA